MNEFGKLFEALDETTSTKAKVQILADYFARASAEDSAWVIFFLTGRKIKRLVSAKALRIWICEAAKVPGWLFEESYEATGDLAETVALLMDATCRGEPPVVTENLTLTQWVHQRLLILSTLTEEEQRVQVQAEW
ncbi:MAG: ATP-dependent DNA ligase, partial [Methylotenera sp.]|nr:ATP-dependent DNA ligase [Oligoflexia bacterium]